ncbi:MAG TPA: diacylglycerol kinase family lipid kinase [Candidatus Limiplasma sp.]|jgi:YegS/Rv2252/BmrU family lipid kinase|nr:diacylglycerol kinase family lipid kinase [Candidatus Limiplasma sp.]
MITVIVNPIAGTGYALTVGQKIDAILQTRGIEHTVVYTEGVGHATELARTAAQQGVETVLSVGGDGTLSETAAGLMGTKTALGIIPAGTGNDFIKAIGTPKKWEEALDYVLTHPAHPLDTGVINDSFFINVCGTGFDVMVLDYALTAKKHLRGIWPYLYGVIAAIKTFRPFEMLVEIGDDILLKGKYMLCTIANGRYIGGGIPILPAANVDDGLLDVMVVEPLPRWRIPFYLPAILGGTLMKKKIAHHYRAKRCTLTSPGMRLNLDGEIIPMDSATFACSPSSLLAYWPGKA